MGRQCIVTAESAAGPPASNAPSPANLIEAAGVIPVRAGGDVLLLLRDDRPDLSSPNRWATLGGHMEGSETPEQAAHREFIEETGRAPESLHYAGHNDGPSQSRPGFTVRSHIFGTPATWTLDDLILAEGQGVAWFPPAAVYRLPLAGPSIAGAIRRFLASGTYRRLAATTPAAPPERTTPLDAHLPARLGLRTGHLLALRGATAGFIGRLRPRLDDVRLTTSLAEYERPDVVLWWPRGEPVAPALAGWRTRLAAGDVLWLLPSEEESGGDGLAAEMLASAIAAAGFRPMASAAAIEGQHAIALTVDAAAPSLEQGV